MDTQVTSVSWIGNICEKFENFYSEIDDIIKQDLQKAENQFLTAGANVKQFCSEFMEELLPESIVNSLQGKTIPSENEKHVVQACQILEKEANGGNTNGFLDSNSSHLSFPIGTVEEAHADSSFCLKANDRKGMSFGQNYVRETKPPSEVPQGDGEYDGVRDFPNPTQVDSQSSYSPPKAGETSDPVPAADAKTKLSTVYQLATSVSSGSKECQLPENEMSSSGHALSRESFDINVKKCYREFSTTVATFNHHHRWLYTIGGKNIMDGSDCQKAEESKDNYVSMVSLDVIQPFNTVKIEDSCVMVDGNELYSTSNMPEQYPNSQRTVCKSCLTMKFEKGCECRKAASSKDNAESDQTEDKFLSQPFLTRELESSFGQDFCESDWVII